MNHRARLEEQVARGRRHPRVIRPGFLPQHKRTVEGWYAIHWTSASREADGESGNPPNLAVGRQILAGQLAPNSPIFKATRDLDAMPGGRRGLPDIVVALPISHYALLRWERGDAEVVAAISAELEEAFRRLWRAATVDAN